MNIKLCDYVCVRHFAAEVCKLMHHRRYRIERGADANNKIRGI
jgi:hypothetical protein